MWMLLPRPTTVTSVKKSCYSQSPRQFRSKYGKLYLRTFRRNYGFLQDTPVFLRDHEHFSRTSTWFSGCAASSLVLFYLTRAVLRKSHRVSMPIHALLFSIIKVLDIKVKLPKPKYPNHVCPLHNKSPKVTSATFHWRNT